MADLSTDTGGKLWIQFIPGHKNFLHSQKKCSILFEMYSETNRRFVDSKAVFDNVIVIFDQVVQLTESLTRFSQKWMV